MKARLLKKLLNNTKYSVSNDTDKICVGSPLCHDLISVDKKSLKIKYAIDTFNEGRKSVEDCNHPELLFIWDKLQELIDSGEIHAIITEDDIIENPLPVFTCEDGKLISTFTDAYGWPNTTITGELMYDNTWFKTEQEAINYGIKENTYYIESIKEQIKQKKKELYEKELLLDELIKNNINLHNILFSF